MSGLFDRQNAFLFIVSRIGGHLRSIARFNCKIFLFESKSPRKSDSPNLSTDITIYNHSQSTIWSVLPKQGQKLFENSKLNASDTEDESLASLPELSKQVGSCMQRDKFRLKQQIRRLSESESPNPKKHKEVAERIQKSLTLVQRRKTLSPQVKLDEELPIFDRRDEIAETIKNNQVVVISGETGSGKSTQLPLVALQLGIGSSGYIGHTQPRRIAARSVANRISSQMGSPLGQQVGFKIRFDDKTGDETFIKLMTDGILLAETQSDRFLDQYEMIIIDEAHERSLNIDFLIGYIKRILRKRADLKIIITSATIDTERFANHFCDRDGNPAPVINVEGRTYPVETRYEPPKTEGDIGGDRFNEHIADTIHQLVQSETGDLLVFLPTERDIKTANKKLRRLNQSGNQIDVLPLYARLSTEQQNAIFKPGSRRRIVLATNVAESSITVPGIRIVVDSGTARISRYAARSKVQRLPIEAVSQASANQRAGRCGRIGPGICVRLYSEEDFDSRPQFTTPEIRRTNLASVILQTMALRLGEIGEFPFMEPPHKEAITDGYKTLFEIGAIDDRRRLTDLGRRIAKMPVDPRIARMLFAADEAGCLNEVLIIASALEIQDPRVRPAEKQQQADEKHEKFKHEKSDFMSYLKVWDFFHKIRSDLSRSKYRIACQQNYLSVSSIHQWQEVHRQLKRIARQNGLNVNDRKDEYNGIHRSLLTGLLSGIAQLGERHEYTGSGGIKFRLWPGSSVFSSNPKWIVAAEVVETTRRYGRTIAKISPEWIEPIAEHLLRYNYVDPHWSKKQQTAMAYENASLFGLPIIARRRVGYTKVDPELTRQLFIENGLIENQISHQFKFLEHNRTVIEGLDQAAAKTRRRDWVLEPALLSEFYGEHLPEQAVDVAALKRILKKEPQLDKKLRITQQDLRVDYDASSIEQQFPDVAQIGSMQLPVEYKFEPGVENDGATIVVPKDGLNQISELEAGWLVPGLNEQRVTALIKSLPKAVRRNFVPVPDTAKEVCQRLVIGSGSFPESVARELSKLCGEPINPNQFDLDKMEDCLRINLTVLDDDGEVIAQGRNIQELRKQLGCDTESFVQVHDDEWNKDGLNSWSWGDLPEQVVLNRGVTNVAVHPAIVDQQESVGLKLVDTIEKANHLTRTGLIRLFALSNRKSLKRQVNWLPELDHHALKLAGLLPTADLKSGLRDAITNLAFVENKKIPRTEQEYENLNAQSVEPISVATQSIAKWLPKWAVATHQALLALENLPSSYATAKLDMQNQITQLTGEAFLTNTPWQWLEHFPRYFAAIEFRCSKLPSVGAGKDQESLELVQHHWEQYLSAKQELHSISKFTPELDRLRWMIEEFRVSLFAQKLGTAFSVSPKRLEKQLSAAMKA